MLLTKQQKIQAYNYCIAYQKESSVDHQSIGVCYCLSDYKNTHFPFLQHVLLRTIFWEFFEQKPDDKNFNEPWFETRAERIAALEAAIKLVELFND